MGDGMNAVPQGNTTTRWQAVCKECQRAGADGSFAYPESWARKTLSRGGTRSNRCPACRLRHNRDAALMAVPYIDVATIAIVQDPANPTGPLGGLGPLPVAHVREEAPSADLAKYDFGLRDDDIRNLLIELETKQVAVVIAGTGSGKSTFLPFRLLYPPDERGRHLADRGQIIVTQPRRCAAIDIAAFVATLADPRVAGLLKDTEGEERKKAVEQLSRMGYFGVGSEIGYRVSGEHAFDANCRLVYVSDGSLLNWLRDGKLDQFGTIIIDEAHERSQNIDFILGYLRSVLPRHPRLRVIIVSATIDGDFFVRFFGGSENVSTLVVEAKKVWGYGEPLWPVKDLSGLLSAERAADWEKPGPKGEDLQALTRKYADLRLPEEEWENCSSTLIPDKKSRDIWRKAIPARIARQVARIVDGTDTGDVLVFLPTERLIEETHTAVTERLEKLSNMDPAQKLKVEKTRLHRLLANASKDEQAAARGEKEDPNCRRIILSTNIAETSLTIDGITFVVDSGLICQTTWDIQTASQDFPTVFHSQDGVRQRWGRVGRKEPGWVFPLYTEDLYNALPPHTPPASVRENAEQSVLKAVGCGIEDPRIFDFPAAFSTGDDAYSESAALFRQELERAYAAHKQRGVLDEQGDLTPLGLEIEPYCGSMAEATAIMVADQFACAIEAVTAMKLLQGGSALIGNNPANNLFEFNWNWDADRRERARRHLMAIRAGCIDELDVVLKVYAAWERAKDDETLGPDREDRQRLWAEKHFVSHAVLKTTRSERNDVLKTLSFNKKSSELRHVLPELAPRVRAVFSYALADLAYERCEEKHFRPMNDCSQSEPRKNADVEIDGFVFAPNADRVIAFRRFSARGRPALSNLVKCYDWAVSKTLVPAHLWSGFVRDVARNLRDPEGNAIGPSYDDHWALWDDYPIGSYVRGIFVQDGGTTRMQPVEVLESGPRGYATMPLTVDDDATSDDGGISDNALETGLASMAQGAVVDASEEPQYEEEGDAEAMEKELPASEGPNGPPPNDGSLSEPRRLEKVESAGQWVLAKSSSGRELPSDAGIVQIVGFEGLGKDRVVLVEPVVPPTDTITKLQETAKKHGTVQLKVGEVVRDWGPPYLACRETDTGVLVVLGHRELSLNVWEDKQFAEVVPEGAVFDVTVVWFDATEWLVRATRIPQLLAHWAKSKTRMVRKKVRGKFQESPVVRASVRGTSGANADIVMMVVDGGEPNTGLIFRFSQKMDRLVPNVFTSRDDVCQDAELSLCVLPSDEPEPLKLPDDIGEGGQDLDKFFRGIDAIEWQDKKRKVQSKGKPISGSTRDKLLDLSPSLTWHEKVWGWWVKTNSLKVVFPSPAQSVEREDAWQKFKEDDLVEGTVSNLTDYAAFIDLGSGVTGFLHVSEICWRRPNRPADALELGQSVRAKVVAIDQDKHRINLSIKSTQPSLTANDVGQVLDGRVLSITDRLGAFVYIGQSRDGLVHISEIVDGYVNDIWDHVSVGDKVRVKVLDVTPDGKIRLSMKDVGR
jgi:HrpA-like RNA helicase/predicted RNA-binding protein with RPS1 domain